jgi:hypothetical protein
VAAELDGQVTGEVLDRRDVRKSLIEALAEEPLETLSLDVYEVRDFEYLGDLRERTALADTCAYDGGTFSAGHQAIPPSGVEAG